MVNTHSLVKWLLSLHDRGCHSATSSSFFDNLKKHWSETMSFRLISQIPILLNPTLDAKLQRLVISLVVACRAMVVSLIYHSPFSALSVSISPKKDCD